MRTQVDMAQDERRCCPAARISVIFCSLAFTRVSPVRATDSRPKRMHPPWAVYQNGSEPNHCPNSVRISHRALLIMFCQPCKQTLPPQAWIRGSIHVPEKLAQVNLRHSVPRGAPSGQTAQPCRSQGPISARATAPAELSGSRRSEEPQVQLLKLSS